jgi:uncharacterized membrane protein
MARRQQKIKLTTWTIPLIYVTVTLAVGMAIPRVEHHLFPNLVSTISVGAAMAICSSVSSGMIALTGIVFSLAFVMVQFSATTYSPRLVLWVARDPVVSHSLGMFISTFLYSLILLAWVDRSDLGKVPMISSYLVFLLLLASMGMFIALIERMRLLQVNRMLIFINDQGTAAINELYPAVESRSPNSETPKPRKMNVKQTLTHIGRPQVIQAVNVTELVKLAEQSDALIEMTAAVGDTVLESTSLLRVYNASEELDEHLLKGTLQIGGERTFEQDPKYAIRLVVDIAIKALSPAINDPTTAVQALDHIEDLLLRLGRRPLEVGRYHDGQGELRLTMPVPTWDDFLRLGLDEIRFCGANSVQVMRRMKALIKNLLVVLPDERHVALRHWEQRLQATIKRTFADAEEKQDASVADRQGLGISQESLASAH